MECCIQYNWGYCHDPCLFLGTNNQRLRKRCFRIRSPNFTSFLIKSHYQFMESQKKILESRWYYILNTLYFIVLILIYIKLFSIYMMDMGNLNDNMLGIFPIIMMIANYGFLISSLFLKKIEINPYNYHGRIVLILILISIVLSFHLSVGAFSLMKWSTMKNLALSAIALFETVTLFHITFTSSNKIKIKCFILMIVLLLNLNFLGVMGSIFLYQDADTLG